jgi:hypothetical protein
MKCITGYFDFQPDIFTAVYFVAGALKYGTKCDCGQLALKINPAGNADHVFDSC